MNINITNYEEWMIDYIEGNLSPAQQKELTEFLAFHPELQADLDLFSNTKVQPDMDIVFANKEALKKETGARVVTLFSWVKYSAATAALVMVFFGIRYYNNQSAAPVAIQKYEYQNSGDQFAIDRPVNDKIDATTKEQKQKIKNPTKEERQFAQDKKVNKNSRNNIEDRQPNKNIDLHRAELNVADVVEYAIAKPIHEDKEQPQLADKTVHQNVKTTASVNKKNKDNVNISLNDNNSVVDWWNDAVALGGEVEKVAVGIINYDVDPFKGRNANNAPTEVKTRSINVLGFEYYSRKKN